MFVFILDCDYNIENKNDIKLILDKANISPEEEPEDMHKEISTQMRFTKWILLLLLFSF